MGRSTLTTSGRPDGKVIEHCSLEGQNGLVCFAIPNANKPTYKHQEEVRRNLVDGYIENGVETIIGMSNSSASHNRFYPIGDFATLIQQYPDNYLVYGYCYISGGNAIAGNLYRYYHVGDNYYINNFDGSTVFNGGGGSHIVSGLKSPYLVTQGTTTHTDIIGDPAPYNQNDATTVQDTDDNDVPALANDGSDTVTKDFDTGTYVFDVSTAKMWKTKVDTLHLDSGDLQDTDGNSIVLEDGDNVEEIKKGYPLELRNRLASGKGDKLVANLVDDSGDSNIPDGTKTTFKISQKVINQLQVLKSTNAGETWSHESVTFDSVVNTVTFETAPEANAVIMVSNKIFNQPAISIDTPQPIQTVDRNLIASNSHSVYAYNGLTYAASSKVATGSSVESKYVDDIFIDNTKSISTVPKSGAITLDNQSIVASKALLTQTSNATQVFTQEMIYDSDNSTWNDTNEFDQLTSGIINNAAGKRVQTKILYKPSSILIGDK